uniref:5-(Carboxyamino)imidazole ribonucleotide mutase n=1 Tax=uncultured Bacteroidota bacterium TaxID=152509 RepID=H5SMS6_9BACT|nr:5-(carboxyamino)imidazole ribonucleotide mutase [uncultured Bacteroidetes bacterium]
MLKHRFPHQKKQPVQPQHKKGKRQTEKGMRKGELGPTHPSKVQRVSPKPYLCYMSRVEIVLLYGNAEEKACFTPARAILEQMGISFREEALPTQPSLAHLRQTLEAIGQSICIWAAGASAYLLPVLAASMARTQPLVVIPCPSEHVPAPYLETLFEAVRGYPIAFTQPGDAEAATLLSVHFLATRHPSYADILQAYLQKRSLQPA